MAWFGSAKTPLVIKNGPIQPFKPVNYICNHLETNGLSNTQVFLCAAIILIFAFAVAHVFTG
jgi:hypothetical protein